MGAQKRILTKKGTYTLYVVGAQKPISTKKYYTSWAQEQHEMKKGYYNFNDWRRDRKARTSWVHKGLSFLVCPDCKASINLGTVVAMVQQ